MSKNENQQKKPHRRRTQFTSFRLPEGGAIKDNATGEMEKGSTDVLPFPLRYCRTGARGVLI